MPRCVLESSSKTLLSKTKNIRVVKPFGGTIFELHSRQFYKCHGISSQNFIPLKCKILNWLLFFFFFLVGRNEPSANHSS